MNSKSFYATMNGALSAECGRLGFKRERGTVSLWTLPLGPQTFFYEVAKGCKHPYLPLLGGRFNVHCDLVTGANRAARSVETSLSYMESFTDEDLERMRAIQDGVLTKIVSQKPSNEFDRVLLEGVRFGIGMPFHRYGVLSLPYLDEHDVIEWGTFLASKLSGAVEQIRREPHFFMRTPQTLD